MTKLRMAPDLELPLAFVTEPVGIFANRGKGKSNAAHVLVEQLYHAGLPTIVLDVKGDWFGIRSSSDGRRAGLPFLILGGEHGDVPLEDGSGRMVAQLLAEQRVPTVIDLSAMSKTKARHWVMEFAEALYRVNREPLMLVVDEADVLIPQRLAADLMRLLGAMEDIAKRGRQRGLGITVISQRVADVNKSVTDLLETLFVFAVTGTRTRKAILDWIDDHGDTEEAKGIVATLSKLPPGECWVWAPGAGLMRRVQLDRIQTFDSHATPAPGEARKVPKTLADLDVAAIKEAMTETIERAKADDPRELRKRIAAGENRIRDLERQLAAAVDAEPQTVVEQVPFLSHEDHVKLAELGGHMTGLHLSLGALADRFDAAVADFRAQQDSHQEKGRSARGEAVQRGRSAPRSPRQPSRPTDQAGSPAAQARAGEREQRPANPSGPPDDAPPLKAGARRMVESLGRMHPLRLTTSQWGLAAKLKTTGGTWSTYLNAIKRAGLVEQDAAGWQLTDAGFGYIGGMPAPMTGAELQEHYRSALKAGAARMLDAFIDAYPGGLTKDELSEQTGIVSTGGTFSTYFNLLRRNQLIEPDGDGFVATRILMHGADA